MSLERITRLTEAPIVGKYYLVPTVFYTWGQVKRAWPVFLPRHEDKEHLNFPHQHYHVDPRFLDKGGRLNAKKQAWGRGWDDESQVFSGAQAAPLCNRLEPEHPPIVWKKLRCHRATIEYQFANQVAQKLTPAYLGRQCHRSKSGFICPHKRFPLGSIPAVDGVITCPLHGLQIDQATGKVIGPQVCQ